MTAAPARAGTPGSAAAPQDAPAAPSMSPEQCRDFFWDWLKHEDTLFIERGNFFLLAQSIMMMSWPGIAALADGLTARASAYVFGLVGIILAGAWLYLSARHIHTTERPIKAELMGLVAVWKEIRDRRRESRLPFAAHKLVGWFIPALFIAAWIVLIACYSLEAFPMGSPGSSTIIAKPLVVDGGFPG